MTSPVANHPRDERRAAPGRPAVPLAEGALYPAREGLS